MSEFENWAIDASKNTGKPGTFTFVPYKGGVVWPRGEVVAAKPPGKLVGVYHPSGPDLAQAWYNKNKEVVDKLAGIESEDESS
jgi:hypothetical protein